MVQEGSQLVSQDAGGVKGLNRSPCRAGLGMCQLGSIGGLVAAQARLGKAYVSFWIASVLAMRFDHQAEGGKWAFAPEWRPGGIKGCNGKNGL